jgi:hypothetical protein
MYQNINDMSAQPIYLVANTLLDYYKKFVEFSDDWFIFGLLR